MVKSNQTNLQQIDSASSKLVSNTKQYLDKENWPMQYKMLCVLYWTRGNSRIKSQTIAKISL